MLAAVLCANLKVMSQLLGGRRSWSPNNSVEWIKTRSDIFYSPVGSRESAGGSC